MLPIVKIIRMEESDEGTIGALVFHTQVLCFTLEPSDEENAKNISSIPAQMYKCKRINSPKYGDCFEITNVPGRDNILIHWGNDEDDTEGCVILGMQVGTLGGKRAVLNSKHAFYGFMGDLEDYDEFHLIIEEHY